MIERPFAHRLDSGAALLVLSGDVDETAAHELRGLVDRYTHGLTTDLTIDLSDVDLLPSSAIAVLVVSQRDARARGAAIGFVAAEDSVAARILKLCGLDFQHA